MRSKGWGGGGLRDGKQDLVVACGIANNCISVLLGNGDGTFRQPAFYKAAPCTYAVARTDAVYVGDFNGDGKLDVFAEAGCDAAPEGRPFFRLSFLAGEGNGAFAPPIHTNVNAGGDQTSVQDYNLDGKLGVVSAGLSAGLYIYPGNGKGTFQSPVWFPYYGCFGSSADLNHDGKPDIVPELHYDRFQYHRFAEHHALDRLRPWADVVGSSASVNDTKPTPRCPNPCRVVRRSVTERPQRSRGHTSTPSISERRIWLCRHRNLVQPLRRPDRQVGTATTLSRHVSEPQNLS